MMRTLLVVSICLGGVVALPATKAREESAIVPDGTRVIVPDGLSSRPIARLQRMNSMGTGILTGMGGKDTRVWRAPHNDRLVIAQIADMHMGINFTGLVDPGPAAKVEIYPEANEQFLESLCAALDQCGEVDFAVLTGDQVSAEDGSSQWDEWRKITDELQTRRIPHSSILGNHDDLYLRTASGAESFSQDLLSGSLQDPPELTGHEMMVMDAELPLSLSSAAQLGNASSTYVLHVLPPPHHGDAPLLSMIHLDTGGGSEVFNFTEQSRWLRAQLAALKGKRHPVLIFQHYPPPEMFDHPKGEYPVGAGGACWGDAYDDQDINDHVREVGELHTAIKESGVNVSLFFGHKHSDNFCCQSGSVNMCFAQHSAPSSYYDERLGIGLRLIELTTQPSGAWKLETRIVLTNGSVVYRAVLAELDRIW